MPPSRPPVPDRTFIAYIAGVGRAGAVVRGLLRTGKARPRRLADSGDDAAEFIRLDRHAAQGASYWVQRTGTEIRAGLSFATAQPLSAGFVELMARVGRA
jgi:hypothetical protein